MKTIKKIFFTIAMCLIGIVITSCVNSNVTSLTIKSMPSTTFEVGKTKIENLMTIVINDNSSEATITLEWQNTAEYLITTNENFKNKVKIENFKLDTEGNFTASVTYNSSVSYFDYQVVAKESLFAGGNGSVNNPYQITNAKQFLNINNVETKDKYFKLMNDIDLSSVIDETNMKADTGWKDSWTIVQTFEGVLDGNNKKLYNVNYNDIQLGKETKPAMYVFGELSGATLKNIDVYMNGTSIGLSLMGNSYGDRPLNFNNVDLYGTIISQSNYGGYMTYTGTFKYQTQNTLTGSATNLSINVKDQLTGKLSSDGNSYTQKDTKWCYSKVNFVDCDSYVSNITTVNYVSVFVGVPLGEFAFNNCWNYGYVEAPQVATFFCNGYINNEDFSVYTDSNNSNKLKNDRPGSVSKYTIINSGNKGTLSYVTDPSVAGIIAVSGTKIKATSDSSTATLGTTKQIPSFNFFSFAKLNSDTKQLSLENVDSNVVKVKVSVFMKYMSYASDLHSGTTTSYVTKEFNVTNQCASTHVYLESLPSKSSNNEIKKGEIKIKRDSSIASSDSSEWLVWDETSKCYIFDGSKAMSDATCTGGKPWISVFAYDANGNVVSAYMAELTEIPVK